MRVGVTQVSYELCERNKALQQWTTLRLLREIASHGFRTVKLWIKNHPFDGAGLFTWTTPWGTKMQSACSNVPIFEDMDRVWRFPWIDTMLVRFMWPGWAMETADGAGVVWEQEPTFDIATKLLKRYGNLNKTIIISNWESDWQWRGVPGHQPGGLVAEARLDFLRSEMMRRQKAVETARAMYPEAQLKVLHAAVVNFTEEREEHFGMTACKDAIAKMPSKPDLVGLTHWGRRQPLRDRLDYIRDTTGLPPERIYIDEVGAVAGPDQGQELKTELDVAADFGCPHAFLWLWKQTWYDRDNNLGLWTQAPGQGKVVWAGPAEGMNVAKAFIREAP